MVSPPEVKTAEPNLSANLRSESLVPRQDPLDPMAMIAKAIELKVDAEQLRQLTDLARDLKKDAAKEAYNQDMVQCQAEMPVVVRDKANTFTKSRYARLETIQNLIRPIYTKYGFSMSFGTDESKLENHIGVYADCIHRGGHVVRHRGDFALDDVGSKGSTNKTPIQAAGSTLSYARRYLTLLIFNVTIADEDTDGNPTVGTLQPDMIARINDLLLECEQIGDKRDVDLLCRWASDDEEKNRLDLVPVTSFELIVRDLTRRIDAYHKKQKGGK